MLNIYDYLIWRGDLSFKKAPFNEVDNLILSEFAYLNLDGILNEKGLTIKEAIDTYFKTYTEKQILSQFPLSQNPIPFFKELSKAFRFNNCKVYKYVNKISKKEDKQFSAITIKLNRNTLYVAFKGTDNTLVGWKEDFNMSFLDIIPSQQEAVEYLNHINALRYKNIFVGGHSKGGNLAIYAAINCKKKLQKKIRLVYNNDGPGFLEHIINSSNYLKMLPKIITILPETSIIGMLLNQKGEYKVVKSRAKGIWQHDALSWQVEKDHFITIKKVDETSNKIRLTITAWLEQIDKKERELFVNSLFSIFSANKIETVEQLSKIKMHKIPGLVYSFTKLDEKERKMIILFIKELIQEASKNFNKKSFLFTLKYKKRKEM